MYDRYDEYNYLTVAQLAKVLSTMDDRLLLRTNDVGNLLVLTPLSKGPIGFIDFREDGKFEEFANP